MIRSVAVCRRANGTADFDGVVGDGRVGRRQIIHVGSPYLLTHTSIRCESDALGEIDDRENDENGDEDSSAINHDSSF